MSKEGILNFMRTQALLGWAPRHIVDPPLARIAVDQEALEEARARVQVAAKMAETIADEAELQCHELGSIEDAGLAGAFRRLLAIACMAVQVHDRVFKGGSAGYGSFVVETHRAVEERWVGGTYELSNCLAPLSYGATFGWDVIDTVGAWIWLNLASDEGPRSQFRWVMSTRRFERSIGEEVVKAARDEEVESAARLHTAQLREEKSRPAPEGQGEEFSEAEIRRIAYDHLREATDVPGAIREIVRGDQLRGREPLVYMGPDWERQWIVFFEQHRPKGSLVLGPSLIMAIDRETGEVTYYGSANDEG